MNATISRLEPAPAEPVDQVTEDLLKRLPPVMSPKTLGGILEVSPKTLERMRLAQEGPKPTKLPGTTMWRYLRADVVEYLTAGRGYPRQRDRLE